MSILAKFRNENCLEAGIDEAGRGPLFGRVYVGAAILSPDDSFNHSLINTDELIDKLEEKALFSRYGL